LFNNSIPCSSAEPGAVLVDVVDATVELVVVFELATVLVVVFVAVLVLAVELVVTVVFVVVVAVELVIVLVGEVSKVHAFTPIIKIVKAINKYFFITSSPYILCRVDFGVTQATY
jgi:hypothetical protein